MLKLLSTALLLAFVTPAFAADPICLFAVEWECVSGAAQCQRDVNLTSESDAVKNAELAACDAKSVACAELMRRPDEDCATLQQTLDATLRGTRLTPAQTE